MEFQRNRSVLIGLVGAALAPAAAQAQGLLYEHHGGGFFAQLGTSVSGLGDVDHDGFDDYLIGAQGVVNPSGKQSGAAFVRSGKNGSALFTVYGEGQYDGFGGSVDGVGDVNGDGYVDWLGGASGDDNTGAEAGNVRVLSGKDASVLYAYDGAAGDRLGQTVAGVGDLDNDGVPDFAAAHGPGGFSSIPGTVHTYSGATGAPLHTFQGGSATEWLGVELDGAFDADGDGFDDLVAGGPGATLGGTDAGVVRVFSGMNGSPLHVLVGDSTGDMLGLAVCSPGDVDGDGFGDILAGAPFDDNAGLDSGSARLVSGKTGAILRATDGASSGDRFGFTVSAAGEVDGDPFPDYLIGATYDDQGATDGGSATVFSGAGGAPLYTVVSELEKSHFPVAAAAAGDVNGDGVGDFVGGAVDVGLIEGIARVYSGVCGDATPYGSGCAGSGAFTPQLDASGCPTPGGTVSLEIGKGLGGAHAFLFLGVQQVSLPMGGGCTLNVSPAVGPIGPLPLAGAGAGTGSFSLTAKLPVPTPLATVTIQAFVADPGTATGFANSNGLEMVIE